MLDLEKIANSGELFDGHYKLLDPLSTDGATADIWLAVDMNTIEGDDKKGLKVAIKVYRPQNALDVEGTQRFRSEFKVVFNCQHSNLLHPVHFSVYKDTPYLVLPYCKNGSTELLTGQVTKNDDIWKFIYDVASGLKYLHTNDPQIIHQDIKPANILIDDKQNYTITDFGISIASDNKNASSDEYSGTMAYMAPERFAEDPMPESDIWAFGATLYELITGNVPFGEDGGSAMPKDKIKLYFPDGISNSIKRLIYACLDVNPDKRPTAAELIKAAEKKEFPINHRQKIGVLTMVIALCALIVFSLVSLLFSPSKAKDSKLPKEETTIIISKKDSVSNEIVEDTPKKSAEPAIRKESPKTIEVKEPKKKQLNGLDLGYAIWEGSVKNGKPEGYGTMRFKESHFIDSRNKSDIAQSGEKVTGNMINGRWEYYKWTKNDGSVISNYIGQ